jgi:hypothetical protein
MKLTHLSPVQYKFITSKYKIFIRRYRGLMPRLLKRGKKQKCTKVVAKEERATGDTDSF